MANKPPQAKERVQWSTLYYAGLATTTLIGVWWLESTGYTPGMVLFIAALATIYAGDRSGKL